MKATSFAAFHRALFGRPPSPWLARLAARVSRTGWPGTLVVPAEVVPEHLLGMAVHALAADAHRPTDQRRVPRRLWWIVPMRPVVHEVFAPALRLAQCLRDATEGPLAWTSHRLRELAGGSNPLAVASLEDGFWRDSHGARVPSQPAIIGTSVDQAGGAVLFRTPGAPDALQPILAGLVAHDSLLLVQEHPSARPFLETLRRVAELRSPDEASIPVRTPFQVCRVHGPDAGTARGHAPTEAGLLVVRDGASGDRAASVADAVVQCLARWQRGVLAGPRQVGVVLDSVEDAAQVTTALRRRPHLSTQVHLLTSAMRPGDLEHALRAAVPESRPGPGIESGLRRKAPDLLVLGPEAELGIGIACDALITEAPDWDTLKRRIARLLSGTARSVGPRVFVLSPNPATPAPSETERPGSGEGRNAVRLGVPTRGLPSLGDHPERRAPATMGLATWHWLQAIALPGDPPVVRIDDAWTQERQRALGARAPVPAGAPMLPVADPPFLLAGHLELLAQTSPRPVPEPDVAFYTRARARGEPTVRIVLRADLVGVANSGAHGVHPWIDAISLLPPTSGETYRVPLATLCRVLREASPASGARFVHWRGRDASQIGWDPSRLGPDDVVVLPAALAVRRILPPGILAEATERTPLDVAEASRRQADGRLVVRLNRDVLRPWAGHPLVRRLLRVAEAQASSQDDLRERLEELGRAMTDELRLLPSEVGRANDSAGARPARSASTSSGTDPRAALRDPLDLPDGLPPCPRAPSLPRDWVHRLRFLAEDGFRCEPHPIQGWVLTGLQRRPLEHDWIEEDLSAAEDGLDARAPRSVALAAHSRDVAVAAGALAERCLDPGWIPSLYRAGLAHDLGKHDARFQQFLRFGDQVEPASAPPLACSSSYPERSGRRHDIRLDAGLPDRFRVEAASLEHPDGCPHDGDLVNDLARHLVASQNGRARPFLPPSDPAPDSRIPPVAPSLTAAERFWRLVRRHGPWGLAYFEAVFRGAHHRVETATATHPPTPLEPSGLHPEPSPPSSPRVDASSARKATSRWVLNALRAQNPLAFLAAVGTLRVLTRALPAPGCVQLGWESREDGWRPFLVFAEAPPWSQLGHLLLEHSLPWDSMFSPGLLAAARGAGKPDRLAFPVAEWRAFCRAATRDAAEFAAAWAVETSLEGPPLRPWARRTRLDFTAGQQAFLRMLREARDAATPEILVQCLADRWRYVRRGVSFRWDPLDEKRQYALQAIDPADTRRNPHVAAAGVHLLAAAALPLFPLVPDLAGRQVGFSRGGDGPQFQWPVWIEPVSLATLRSLLAVPWDDPAIVPPRRRAEHGVVAVYQAAIVQPGGRYRCFSPARAI